MLAGLREERLGKGKRGDFLKLYVFCRKLFMLARLREEGLGKGERRWFCEWL